jgi:hypothetical protein
VSVSELGARLAEQAGALAREEGALREAQHHWAETLHEQPENGDALGALVLIGAALYLLRDTQGS